jgi:hypothetical protein
MPLIARFWCWVLICARRIQARRCTNQSAPVLRGWYARPGGLRLQHSSILENTDLREYGMDCYSVRPLSVSYISADEHGHVECCPSFGDRRKIRDFLLYSVAAVDRYKLEMTRLEINCLGTVQRPLNLSPGGR